MKRALKIIGRFAFGGWALVMGVMALAELAAAFVAGGFESFRADWFFVYLFVYSFIGIAGGGIVGLITAVLDRLIKRPVVKTTANFDAADPSVWPPPPEI